MFHTITAIARIVLIEKVWIKGLLRNLLEFILFQNLDHIIIKYILEVYIFS